MGSRIKKNHRTVWKSRCVNNVVVTSHAANRYCERWAPTMSKVGARDVLEREFVGARPVRRDLVGGCWVMLARSFVFVAKWIGSHWVMLTALPKCAGEARLFLPELSGEHVAAPLLTAKIREILKMHEGCADLA